MKLHDALPAPQAEKFRAVGFPLVFWAPLPLRLIELSETELVPEIVIVLLPDPDRTPVAGS